MPGLSIPGVTDKYNTNNTVERLMELERVPLNREQETLKTYQSQQNAWRDVNMKLSSLRDSVRTLYSFDSPFQSKIAESSNENAVTAEAGHDAAFGSFSVDVKKLATADRFLSAELEKDAKIDAGTYVFTSGEKSISMKWNGGTVQEFVNALNRRGDNTFRANVINSGSNKKVLLIESLKTGSENRLSFDKDALSLVQKIGMMGKKDSEAVILKQAATTPLSTVHEQDGMPELEAAKIGKTETALSPRTSLAISLADANEKNIISFTITASKTEDITEELNSLPPSPVLPKAGSASINEIVIPNFDSETTLPVTKAPPEHLNAIETADVVYAIMEDGSEKLIETPDLLAGEKTEIKIDTREYGGIIAVAVRNRNTGTALSVSEMTATSAGADGELVPLNAVTEAGDAVIKYEGITITRPTNKIDDVIPNITLNISDTTDKTATITIKSDSENAKDALITFVGQYNQVVAEVNILTQNKPELVEELTYLSESEKEAMREKIGMFQGDFTLSNIKNSMQSIIIGRYENDANSDISMLSQLGISSNASGGGGGYNASRLRGYLEIDERTLDNVLSNSMGDIRRLFGYDSDGDLVIDSGIGYRLDQQILAYTQSNGIISSRTNTINSQIRSSEQRISRLESQLATREQQLKQQFAGMESALNSLESQQTTIDNFMQQNSNNRR